MKLNRKAIGGAALTASMVVMSASTAFAGINVNAGVSSVLHNIVEERVTAAQTQEVASGDNDSSADDWSTKVLANVEGASNVNVRESADVNSETVGKLRVGDAAEILEQGDEWTLITSGNVTGYVRNDYLLYGDDAKAAAEERGTVKVTVATTTLKVRESAAEDSKVAGLAAEGDEFVEAKGAEEADGWIAVTYDDASDDVAYVSKDYVSTELVLGTAITVEEEQAIAAEKEAAAKAKEEAAQKAAEEKKVAETKTDSTPASDSSAESSTTSTSTDSTKSQSTSTDNGSSANTQSTANITTQVIAAATGTSTQTTSTNETTSASTESESTDTSASTDSSASTSSSNSSASVNYASSGSTLTKTAGVFYGPSGKETYYNLDMSGVISTMRSLGYTGEYAVRADGVKTLGGYVMVAANLSVYPKGTLVSTSLGTGIVCDTGGFVYNGSGVVFDIATNW